MKKTSSKKVLISSFETFGEHPYNPTILLMNKLLDVSSSQDWQGITLPVSFGNAFKTLATKINQFQPDLIISLGLAGNRTLLCLEKQAINLIKCDIADNDGEKILDRVIRPEGAHFLKTSIDLDKLEKQLLNHYEFLQISDNAGTFVCNFLYYQLLKEYPQTPSLFIHIPMIASNSSEFEQYTEALLQLIAKIDSL